MTKTFTSCLKIWRKRSCAAVLLNCILLISCLTGCWSQRELSNIAIVVGTGLDTSNQPDSLKLTAQVVKASEMGSSASSQGSRTSEKAYVNISYADQSVLSAVRGVTHMQNRRLYFSHNKVLIFSSDLAKLDMAEGLDAFTRDYEGRMDVQLLISRGKASKILEEEADLEKVPALHLYAMMENQKLNSETVVITLRDFVIATMSDSRSPVAPIIKLYKSEEGKNKVKLDGTAVFKQGKMIGELDVAQTRGLLWVTNKAQSGALTVNTDWGQVILEFLHANSILKPVKAEDGTIRMELTVHEDGAIESNETTQNMSRIENVEMLKELMKEAIQSDIQNVLAQARTLSADVFGFGEAIRRDYPKDWEAMKKNWDTMFPQIELDIRVDVKLRFSGGLAQPIIPGGA
ncbi:Ger(x)C family spore germination protein [Paenibacillus sp. YN15]|uniref:Ger(x)C family spore germination protein n=1 Tax=Paenibacillus sp. YN15 TaxID=1742774 RepID=UPI000DCCC561|nr:Ger(x)C family spore germination protein [Paenibacillus sp. YN15]RAV03473.1 hypothetical protein DQG13_07125 [Paenibacillus sp. YN15]